MNPDQPNPHGFNMAISYHGTPPLTQHAFCNCGWISTRLALGDENKAKARKQWRQHLRDIGVAGYCLWRSEGFWYCEHPTSGVIITGKTPTEALDYSIFGALHHDEILGLTREFCRPPSLEDMKKYYSEPSAAPNSYRHYLQFKKLLNQKATWWPEHWQRTEA